MDESDRFTLKLGPKCNLIVSANAIKNGLDQDIQSMSEDCEMESGITPSDINSEIRLSVQDCYVAWEEAKRNQREEKLREFFVMCTQRLLNHFDEKTLTSKDKMIILNFLCLCGIFKVKGNKDVEPVSSVSTDDKSLQNKDGRLSSYDSETLTNESSGDFSDDETEETRGRDTKMPRRTTEGAKRCDTVQSIDGELTSPRIKTEPLSPGQCAGKTDQAEMQGHQGTIEGAVSNDSLPQMMSLQPLKDYPLTSPGVAVAGFLPYAGWLQGKDSLGNYGAGRVDMLYPLNKVAMVGASFNPYQQNLNSIGIFKETGVNEQRPENNSSDGNAMEEMVRAECGTAKNVLGSVGYFNAGLLNNQDDVGNMQGEKVRPKRKQTVPRRSVQNPEGDEPFQCVQCDMTFKLKAELKVHTMQHDGVKLFECEFCDRTFFSNKQLVYHVRVHSGEMAFTCVECGKAYRDRSNLQKHMKTHLGEGLYTCEVCGKVSIQKSDHAKHMRQHTGETPFKCDECGKCFNEVSQLYHHAKVHQAKSILCEYCGQSFRMKSALEVHLKTHTEASYPSGKPLKDAEKKLHTCKICGEVCRSRTQLKTHRRTKHRKPQFPCHFCGEFYENPDTLLSHAKEAHGQTALAPEKVYVNGKRMFKCHNCGKCFKDRCGLTRHVRGHSDKKPFSCDLCGAGFRAKQNLIAHKVKYQHGENADPTEQVSGSAPRYQCEFCDRVFSCKNDVVYHRTTHTGERAYKCQECGQGFNDKANLRLHMKRHTGEGVHKCHICGKVCMQRGDLNKHIRIHTGEKPFKCEMCPRVFTEPSYMYKHMRVHTDKPFKCEHCDERFEMRRLLHNHKRVHMNLDFKCDYCTMTFGNRHNLRQHIMRNHASEKYSNEITLSSETAWEFIPVVQGQTTETSEKTAPNSITVQSSGEFTVTSASVPTDSVSNSDTVSVKDNPN